MPTITYHEFRPGKWVKLVDGKVVGPATAAEVAAWRREKATPARIWEDVVATASRPPLGEVKVTKSSTAKPEVPAGPGARREPDQSTIWEDVVKRTKPSVQAESPPERHPRKEDTDWAEQVQTWANVAKRVKKPEQPPVKGAPVSPKPAPEVKPTLAAKAPKPMAEAKVEEKPVSVKRTPEAKPAPKPTPPAKVTAKAEAKPARGPSPAQKAAATKLPPAHEAPAAKVAPAIKPAAKPAKQAKAPKRGKHAKPATRGRLPVKLLDEIAEQESAPPSKLPKEAMAPEGKARTTAKARSRPAAVSRRSSRKAKTAAPQERPNQLYLWIAAGQADDLVATVRIGLARYQERFSHPAEVVLCHNLDLPTLEGAKLPVDLREGKSLPPRNFWIGLK